MSQELVSELRDALGDSAVFDDPRTLEFHSADALNPARAYHTPASAWGTPLVVIMPTSTEDVVRTVQVAQRHRTPIVCQGGGTGLMGAAVPGRDTIVVDLKLMDRVRTISTHDRLAWAEAGVVIKDLDMALNQHGLMVGHDPYSTPIATVGGTISTDSVGYRAARYGSMGAQVLALEVVLSDGAVLTTKSVPKNASGPRLDSLFIGAEGTFGIITAAALRVFRVPEERQFVTVSFPTFNEGFQAVSEMFAIGLRPALTDLTEDTDGSDGGWRVLLYMVFEGYREEVAAQRQRTSQICTEFSGTDRGPWETEQYWRERHRSGDRYLREVKPLPPSERWSRWWSGANHWEYLHMALPVSQVLEFRKRAEAIAQENGASVREYAIWTEPELFSMIMTRAVLDSTESPDSFAEAVGRVLRLAQDMGGTMEYCHGVGLKLAHLVGREWGSGLELARRLKRAVDPHGIMNPGKLGL